MTPAYASPQMLEGRAPTPSDDVFALAIVAHELLTGQHPFDYQPRGRSPTACAEVRAVARIVPLAEKSPTSRVFRR